MKKAEKENQAIRKKMEERGSSLEALRTEYFQNLSEHTEIQNESVRFEKEIELLARQETKLTEQLTNERALLEQKTRLLEQKRKEL